MELKHDFQKFYSFIEKSIPKSEYLVNNFDPVGEEEAEAKIMGKASAMQWDSRSKEDRVFEELSSLKKQIGTDPQSTLSELNLKLDSKIELTGREKLEVRNDLDDEDLETDRGEEALFKQIYEKGIHDYRVYPKSTILGTTVSANTKKINAANDLLIFEQEGFMDKPSIRTNWIYAYGLPYDLERYGENEMKEGVFKAASRIGKVKNVLIASFKNFLNEGTSNLLIPKNIGAFFEENSLKRFLSPDKQESRESEFHDISTPVNKEMDPGTIEDQLSAEEPTQEQDSDGPKKRGRRYEWLTQTQEEEPVRQVGQTDQ